MSLAVTEREGVVVGGGGGEVVRREQEEKVQSTKLFDGWLFVPF